MRTLLEIANDLEGGYFSDRTRMFCLQCKADYIRNTPSAVLFIQDTHPGQIIY